jgi:bifunctional non-homologous end joining protein LigD
MAKATLGRQLEAVAHPHTGALEGYKQKRHFDTTPEPRPHLGRAHRRPIFVVQEHHASRLHYDFRLEADGVLKSWAVPKQPSLNPTVKRLAVQVEDHPLEYANFSGEIPAGQYGAGLVHIWDKGTYENLLARQPHPQSITEGIDAGHLEVQLHGRRLKGNFALIRMSKGSQKASWLLIKMQDKEARPGPVAAESTTTASTPRLLRARPAALRNGAPSQHPASFAFTNQDKIMFPEVGITKGDVLRFYERIAPHLLPHLRHRPMTVERFPEGLRGKHAPHFWQKNTPSYYPQWIPRVTLPSEAGQLVTYALVNDAATLLYLVNQGTLTFHPWLSRIQNLDRPDFVIFDLDPGTATFADTVAVAKQLHAILEGEKVASYLKTSGKTGLHIMVSWHQAESYDAARDWAMGIALRVVADLPEIATVERRKERRQKKVYIDVLQNTRGHHVVPPYVLRAVPQATVSTPLTWAELTPALQPQRYNLKTIFRRLARQKIDPMASLVAR